MLSFKKYQVFCLLFLCIIFLTCNCSNCDNGNELENMITIATFNIQVFGQLLNISNIMWIVKDGIPTNTRGTETYDNLVFINNQMREFNTGEVFNFQIEYQLSDLMALEISDHFPVYGRFKTNMQDDD